MGVLRLWTLQEASPVYFSICQLDGCATCKAGTFLGLDVHSNMKRVEIFLWGKGCTEQVWLSSKQMSPPGCRLTQHLHGPACNRGLELDEHCGPFQPRPSYGSVIPQLSGILTLPCTGTGLRKVSPRNMSSHARDAPRDAAGSSSACRASCQHQLTSPGTRPGTAALPNITVSTKGISPLLTTIQWWPCSCLKISQPSQNCSLSLVETFFFSHGTRSYCKNTSFFILHE